MGPKKRINDSALLLLLLLLAPRVIGHGHLTETRARAI